MILWTSLLNVLILLVAAMLLGGIFERLKQHAVLGYLLAGALIGPHVLDLMPNHEAIASIAELGVALLLFMIGLEFSWRRLRSLGGIALGGGTLQVAATIVLSMLACVILGLDVREAIVVGAMVALSSTAIVMRLLVDRAAVDSVYGRNVLGILLLQDIAVVPLVLLVTLLGSQGTALQFGWAATHALGAAILLVAALFLILKYILPLMFRTREPGGNQDLPVLLSTVTALGCAWGSHMLGLSPILGAFVGGVILAESPFANRIRADIAPLKTLFITLFFTSIGMLANPLFVLSNWQAVLAITVAILLGKIFVITFVTRLFRTPVVHALATGICLAQIGEFSFVLAEVSRSTQLINAHLFDLMISVTVVTLFITPYLVSLASKVPGYLGRLFPLPQQPMRLYPWVFELLSVTRHS
jgi:CPA2 family monovalent cation:H+ antiporter-2